MPAETCVYACGNPQMIEDVKTRFADTGFQVESERFWKDSVKKRRRDPP